jgi:hypothetical protein
MELNKCILTGVLSSKPTVFSNHLGSYLELSISKEEEIPTRKGTKSQIVNIIVLYAGKLEDLILSLSTGVRLYIEGKFTYGKFYEHNSPSLIFSTNVKPISQPTV